MPAKSTAAAAAPKAKSAKPSATTAAETAPPSPKTVKVARAPGAHQAQVTRRASSDTRIVVSAVERDRLIAEAAYYRAESRGFAPGDEQADWFSAAQEVDAKYRSDG